MIRRAAGSERAGIRMRLRSRRGLAVGLVLALASSILAAPALTQAESSPTPDASGIEVVDDITQAVPTSEEQAQAFEDALQFAMAHPKDVGYPWIDPADNMLDLSAVTDTGKALLGALQDEIAVPNRLREVSFSYGQLEQIRDEVTTLATTGVTDADLIYETAPDHEHDRVIITVSKLSEALLKELADRYGTESIAVRVDPDDLMAGSASRLTDVSPFWGGAKINVPVGTCTTGFPWYLGDNQYAMITAGHCAYSGGTVTTPSSPMGTVTANSEENWDHDHGTQYFTGQSVYRGDLALIRIDTIFSSGPYIYRGAYNSSTYSLVKSMWSRSPVVGDLFYTGASVSGELGTWTVTVINMNKLYFGDGNDVWARNVTEGTKGGNCIQPGDSGGSVFTNTSGGVAAKGIISGMGFLTCYVYFTDIRQAYFGLPGYLRTG